MIGNVSELTKTDVNHPEYTLYIPLQFWFCRNYGLALPKIALKQMNVDIKVKFKTAIECINYTGTVEPTSDLPSISSISLLTEYIYLDNVKRQKFSTSSHEYLIDQLQIDDTIQMDSYNKSYDLTLNNPVKFIIWTPQLERYTSRSSFLSWALDDDWETSKTNFAKLAWLATRDGLDDSGSFITISSSVNNIGDVPSDLSGGNSVLKTIADKVTAYLLLLTQAVELLQLMPH